MNSERRGLLFFIMLEGLRELSTGRFQLDELMMWPYVHLKGFLKGFLRAHMGKSQESAPAKTWDGDCCS